jgi:hypothetical protein
MQGAGMKKNTKKLGKSQEENFNVNGAPSPRSSATTKRRARLIPNCKFWYFEDIIENFEQAFKKFD